MLIFKVLPLTNEKCQFGSFLIFQKLPMVTTKIYIYIYISDYDFLKNKRCLKYELLL